MSTECPILSIESIPGDSPMALEQPNGDLLMPAAGRLIIEQALLEAEGRLEPGAPALALLAQARSLMGMRAPAAPAQAPWLRNLLTIAPI